VAIPDLTQLRRSGHIMML